MRNWPRLAIVVGLTVLVACGQKNHTVRGTITAPECGGGYAIGLATVEVRNESNTLIGTGTTSSASFQPGFSTDPSGAVTGQQGGCRATFSVTVPNAKFYKFRIGSHDGPAYSHADMEGY